MPFQPTVFGQLMKALPRKVFGAAVTGRAKWGLTEWAHLVTLVSAQLAGTRSMRDLLACSSITDQRWRTWGSARGGARR